VSKYALATSIKTLAQYFLVSMADEMVSATDAVDELCHGLNGSQIGSLE